MKHCWLRFKFDCRDVFHPHTPIFLNASWMHVRREIFGRYSFTARHGRLRLCNIVFPAVGTSKASSIIQVGLLLEKERGVKWWPLTKHSYYYRYYYYFMGVTCQEFTVQYSVSAVFSLREYISIFPWRFRGAYIGSEVDGWVDRFREPMSGENWSRHEKNFLWFVTSFHPGVDVAAI